LFVSILNSPRILQLEANIDPNMINEALASFGLKRFVNSNNLGLYLSKQLRMGRAVVIPKLGVITFSAPDVKLEVI
jgi:hypothetical protein